MNELHCLSSILDTIVHEQGSCIFNLTYHDLDFFRIYSYLFAGSKKPFLQTEEQSK